MIAATTIGIIVVLFVSAEVVVRFAVPKDSATQSFRERSLEYLLPCVELVSRGGHQRIVGRRDSARFDHRLERSEGNLRLAVVGESTGFFIGDALSFLTEETDVEVLNCAMEGSGFEHLQRRTAEVLRYRPDVVVIVFGHNLSFRYPLDASQINSFELARKSRFLDLLLSTPQLGGDMSVAESFDSRIEEYRAWLEDLARSDLAQKSRFILLTLPANHWVPSGDAVGCDDDAGVLDAQFDWYRGERQSAIDKLHVLASETRDSCVSFVLATWLRRTGQLAEVPRFLAHMTEGAVWAWDRSNQALHDMVRTMARYDRFSVFDLAYRVAARSPNGIPGWALMRDHCHVNNATIATESLEILRLACDQTGKRLPQPLRRIADYTGEPSISETLEGLILAQRGQGPQDARKWLSAIPHAVEHWVTRDAESKLREMHRFIDARFAEIEPDPIRGALVLAGLAEGLWHSARQEDALALNARARAVELADPWVQLAFFRLADDPGGSLAAAERALQIDPNSAAATFLVDKLRRQARRAGRPFEPARATVEREQQDRSADRLGTHPDGNGARPNG